MSEIKELKKEIEKLKKDVEILKTIPHVYADNGKLHDQRVFQ